MACRARSNGATSPLSSGASKSSRRQCHEPPFPSSLPEPMKPSLLAALGCTVLLLASASHAQTDPLSLPSPRPSPGAYQWGIEMLKFDKAWEITRGRAHLAFSERDEIGPHEDLQTGLDGPLRRHISMAMNPVQT